jgi:hypothetical protein
MFCELIINGGEVRIDAVLAGTYVNIFTHIDAQIFVNPYIHTYIHIYYPVFLMAKLPPQPLPL